MRDRALPVRERIMAWFLRMPWGNCSDYPAAEIGGRSWERKIDYLTQEGRLRSLNDSLVPSGKETTAINAPAALMAASPTANS